MYFCIQWNEVFMLVQLYLSSFISLLVNPIFSLKAAEPDLASALGFVTVLIVSFLCRQLYPSIRIQKTRTVLKL